MVNDLGDMERYDEKWRKSLKYLWHSIKEFFLKVMIYFLVFCIIIIFGFLANNDILSKFLTILVADIGIKYWFTNWVMNKKYRLKEQASRSGKFFDETSYNLYWEINKMRIELIFRVIVLVLALYSSVSEFDWSNLIIAISHVLNSVFPILVLFLLGLILAVVIIFSVPNHEVVEELYEKSKTDFIGIMEQNARNEKEHSNEEN